jgi:hypothetical protein
MMTLLLAMFANITSYGKSARPFCSSGKETRSGTWAAEPAVAEWIFTVDTRGQKGLI